MKICVTGGAGFIGTNFLHYMTEKYPKYDFVCIDNLTYCGQLDNLKDVYDRGCLGFQRTDISDSDAIDQIFTEEKFDIVVNFAAETHVDNSIKNPGIFVQSNIVGTHVLLEACRKHKVNRFHQISTDEVYGDLPLDRKDLFFTEESPIKPSSPYSASKASADLIVMAYYRTFGLSVTISRCSNNYGPFQHEEKLIPLMIKCAQNNKPLPIYGRGENVRDWIHVKDHCMAIDQILHKGKIGEIYNIGGNAERMNLEVVKMILLYLNKPESLITFVTDRPGHDLRYAIDNSKIRRELGWSPRYTFERGLEDTIAWYEMNRRFRQDLIEKF